MSVSASRGRLHVNEFPNVPVQVLKSMSIHKAVILRFVVGVSTGGDCLSHRLVDPFPTLGRQAHKHFRTFRCVANLFGSESSELSLCQEHDKDVLCDYMHAAVSSVNLGSKVKPSFV